MKSQYYVLWNENTGGPDINSSPEATGPFTSVRKAKAFILDDAENSFDVRGAEHLGRDEEWGSRYSIVKCVDVVIPVLHLSARFTLKQSEGVNR